MDKISSWCKFIALFSVLSSLIYLALPDGRSKKAFKLLLSFMMIYSFVSPLSDVETDLNKATYFFDFSKNSTVSESLKNYEYYPVISAAKSETEEYFNGILSAIGAQGYCEAVCDIESDKIILREIRFITQTDESQKIMITEEVNKIYGEEATIIFSGEQ